MSSHTPWTRIPRLIAWNEVGDGSIFNRMPVDQRPGRALRRPRQVQAAYGQSIEYSLSALVSFVQHYGNKNLVLVVLGDHQPVDDRQRAGRRVTTCRSRSSPTTRRCWSRIAGWGWQRRPAAQPARRRSGR